MITITNEDNMKLMARYPNNHFDLAIVDPPYGIMDKIISGGETNRKIKIHKGLEKFNDVVPNEKYFLELQRVSKNQIIWGGNYFVEHLSHSRGWIVWDKKIAEGMSFAMCELAFTSFNKNAKIFRKVTGVKVFHPTEKPVSLYEWLLMNYAKEGDQILDTHGGSMSIALACHNLNFDLTLCELDTEYYEAGLKRLKQHQKQIRLF
jgi:site-specific DNA-methyltransferase (adenine-specific)